GTLVAACAPRPDTLSLHDALPISTLGQLQRCAVTAAPAGAGAEGTAVTGEAPSGRRRLPPRRRAGTPPACRTVRGRRSSAARRSDRKSTRLNSSHVKISYAVFCLK